MDKYERWSKYPYECPRCGFLTEDNTELIISKWSKESQLICKACNRHKKIQNKVSKRDIRED